MEYLDLYDENRFKTGEIIARETIRDNMPSNRYITIVIIFIENSKHEFLIQKTSIQKGSVFATTGGLVESGSNSIETVIKEVKEELGLVTNINEVTLIETRKGPFAFQDTYYLKKDINLKDLILQEEEVEYTKWLSVDEIKGLIDKGLFRKGNIEPFYAVINK